MPKSALPNHLKNRRHDDWLWPFSYIPRAWTSFNWGKPKLLIGNIDSFTPPKPITDPNTWQLSYYPNAPLWAKFIAWYIAYSFPRNKKTNKFRQFRLGARWDNVDNYINWPTFPTLRQYTGDDSQNTKS